MFRQALDYPTRPPAGGRAVLVGGALLLSVPFLGALGGLTVVLAPVAFFGLIAWLLVRGYYVRVIRTTIGRSDPQPPAFDRYGALLVDGLKALFIAAVYLLPALVAVAVAAATANVPSLTGPQALLQAVQAVAGLLALFGLLYAIGALFVVPVAVGLFAYTGQLRAAFGVRTVVNGALTEDYAVAWFVSMLLQLFVAPVAYLLYPILVGFFLRFHVSTGVRYCYGQGIGAALKLEALPVPDSSANKARSTAVRDDRKAAPYEGRGARDGTRDGTARADDSHVADEDPLERESDPLERKSER